MVTAVALMKSFYIAIFGVLFAGVALATPARVGHIIDGDTFSGVVSLDGGVDISVRVRIRNIDTPEIHGACEFERTMAARARDKLSELIPAGTVVELTNIRDDKYLGRIDANVADSRGADVGRAMIRAGLARAYNGGRRAAWCR